MSTKSEKSKQLGESVSTAQHKLRKKIMFQLVQRCGLDSCYQCGTKIVNIDGFSIEHKIPWLHSGSPHELFYDLDNVAFSHLSCNIRASRNAPAKGEDNNVSRITEDTVLSIKHSDEPTSVLSKWHNISTRHVRRLRTGTSWKHLNGR